MERHYVLDNEPLANGILSWTFSSLGFRLQR